MIVGGGAPVTGFEPLRGRAQNSCERVGNRWAQANTLSGGTLEVCPHPPCPPLPQAGEGGGAAPLSHTVGEGAGGEGKQTHPP